MIIIGSGYFPESYIMVLFGESSCLYLPQKPFL